MVVGVDEIGHRSILNSVMVLRRMTRVPNIISGREFECKGEIPKY